MLLGFSSVFNSHHSHLPPHYVAKNCVTISIVINTALSSAAPRPYQCRVALRDTKVLLDSGGQRHCRYCLVCSTWAQVRELARFGVQGGTSN